jgi:site-specific DNA recombinase
MGKNTTLGQLRPKHVGRHGLKTEQTRKRPSHALSLSTVNEMLANRYYFGMVSYEGVLYQGRHQPLIDEATFEAVQAIMSTRQVSSEKHDRQSSRLPCDVPTCSTS